MHSLKSLILELGLLALTIETFLLRSCFLATLRRYVLTTVLIRARIVFKDVTSLMVSATHKFMRWATQPTARSSSTSICSISSRSTSSLSLSSSNAIFFRVSYFCSNILEALTTFAALSLTELTRMLSLANVLTSIL